MCPLSTESTPLPAPPDTGSPLLHRLAASLAHNVNNALTGAIGYLELSLRNVAAGSEQEHYLRASLACAYRAAEAVRLIVTYLCRVRPPEALAPVSLRAVADQAAEEMRRTPTSGLTVVVEGASEGWVRADVLLLQAALQTVLHNALEAMPGGGTLTLSVQEEEGWRRLAVSDTGPGMPEQVLAQPFEPFVTTKPSGHLGLGLALCLEMVQAQGGRLDLRSAPGRGTTVLLSFPAVEAPANRPADLPGDLPGIPPPHPPHSPPAGLRQHVAATRAS
jgi:signal transduction histidine kinase